MENEIRQQSRQGQGQAQQPFIVLAVSALGDSGTSPTVAFSAAMVTLPDGQDIQYSNRVIRTAKDIAELFDVHAVFSRFLTFDESDVKKRRDLEQPWYKRELWIRRGVTGTGAAADFVGWLQHCERLAATFTEEPKAKRLDIYCWNHGKSVTRIKALLNYVSRGIDSIGRTVDLQQVATACQRFGPARMREIDGYSVKRFAASLLRIGYLMDEKEGFTHLTNIGELEDAIKTAHILIGGGLDITLDWLPQRNGSIGQVVSLISAVDYDAAAAEIENPPSNRALIWLIASMGLYNLMLHKESY